MGPKSHFARSRSRAFRLSSLANCSEIATFIASVLLQAFSRESFINRELGRGRGPRGSGEDARKRVEGMILDFSVKVWARWLYPKDVSPIWVSAPRSVPPWTNVVLEPLRFKERGSCPHRCSSNSRVPRSYRLGHQPCISIQCPHILWKGHMPMGW